MWVVIEKIIPTIANMVSDKKCKDKIKRVLEDDGCDNKHRISFNCPSNETDLCELSYDVLCQLYDFEVQRKEVLENKAKTNVIGVTVAVSLIMGAYSLLQSVSQKQGVGALFWIECGLFMLAVAYMMAAGIHAIYSLIAENMLYTPRLGLKGEEKKNDLDSIIGMNRTTNTIRNNHVYTSYECIRNSLVCLFIVMIIAIVPGGDKKTGAQIHGQFYYSEQAMDSLNNGIDRSNIENYVDSIKVDGDHSVINQADKLFIKYSYHNDIISIHLIELVE